MYSKTDRQTFFLNTINAHSPISMVLVQNTLYIENTSQNNIIHKRFFSLLEVIKKKIIIKTQIRV